MATSDLERLVISIEANTKQFERAIRSLDRTTDTAMRGVERSMEESGRRMERIGESIGRGFGRAFRRGVGLLLAGNFIRDALEDQAKQGNLQAQHMLDNWDNFWKFAYEKAVTGSQKISGAIREGLKLGPSLMHPSTGEFTSGIAKEIQDRIPVNPEDLKKGSSALESYLDAFTNTVNTYVSKVPELETAAQGVHRTILQNRQDAIEGSKVGGITAAQQQFILNLEDEIRLLGMSADAQAVYNNQKAAGALRDSVAADLIERETLRLKEQERVKAALLDANNALEDSTKSFVQGLLEGESAVDALNAALRRLADALLDMAFKSLFNPGGTPLLQTILGGTLLGGNTPLGGNAGTPGSSGGSFNTQINVQGSVDQKTLGLMHGMIQRNNAKQNAELQRQWGNHAARYSALRGP